MRRKNSNGKYITLIIILSILLVALLLIFALYRQAKRRNGETGDSTTAENASADMTRDGINPAHETTSAADTASDTAGTTGVSAVTGSIEIESKIINKNILADDGTVLIYAAINCPVVKTTGDYSAEKFNAAVLDFCNGFISGAKNYKSTAEEDYNASGFMFSPYNYSGTFEVTYNSEGLLSVMFTTEEDSGGAHSGYSVKCFTYDLVNDRETELTSMLGASEKEIKAYIKSLFIAQINSNPDKYYSYAKDELDNYININDFCLTDTGITFFLPAYSIAPYITGIPSVSATYAELDSEF